MPKDFLFPPLTGASRLITLSANSPFAPNMLGAIVDLNGFQLNLTGATGYGFFILTGGGTITGAATATLGSTQAMMVAVEDGVFHFIDQPDIDLSALNAQLALKAPLASPALTGIPTAPTASQGTSTTQLATTGFVTTGLAGKSPTGHTHTFSGVDGLQAAIDGINSTLAIKANIASPAFTGTPTGPTAAPGTNTTQFATTAFVVAAVSGLAGGGGSTWGLIGGSISSQGDLVAELTAAKARGNHTGSQAISTVTDLQNQLNLRAPLASPTFTGVPAVPTAAPGTNTTQAASTAFVKELGDTKAPLASPNFSGIPLVDTAAPGTSNRQAASTAFVQAAVAGIEGGGGGMPVLTRSAIEGPPVPGSGIGGNIFVSGITSPEFSGYLQPVAVPENPFFDPEWSTSGDLVPSPSGLWAKAHVWGHKIPNNVTLEEFAPPAGYLATGSQSTASQIQIHNGTSWSIYWLYAGGGSDLTKRWVTAANAAMEDMGSTVLLAGYYAFSNHRIEGQPFNKFIGGAGETMQSSPFAVRRWYFYLYQNGISLGNIYADGASIASAIGWSTDPDFSGTPVFTTSAATTPAGIGQWCRVGPYPLTGGRTEAYDWFLAEAVSPALWRQVDEAQPVTSTNILAALAALSAPEITALRSILATASVPLNPL